MTSSTATGPATTGSFRETLQRLRGAQKPPAAGSPAYSRFVNRRIGRLLAAASFHLGLSPNQVTGVSAMFSGAAIAAVAVVAPNPTMAVLVVAGLLIGYAFDSADGQLARLTGRGSPAGEWLDHVVDSAKIVALHLAVLVSWFRFGELDPLLLLIPLGFTVVSVVFFFAQIITDQLRRAHPDTRRPVRASGPMAVVRSVLLVPTDYGVLCIVFALLAWQAGFLVLYTGLFAGTTLFLAAALPKWFREMKAL